MEKLHIFVNNKKKIEKDGVTNPMTVDAIAHLVGLTAETAVVRRVVHGKPGEPLSGSIEVKNGEHFRVTRKNVKGGYGYGQRS